MRIKINYLNRITVLSISLITFILLGTVALAAQDQTKDQFRDRLCQILQENGWSTAQVNDLREQKVDWGQARVNEARVVAYALMYDHNSSAPLDTAGQARLAIQLAEAARELKQLGQNERDIAIVAIQATQAVQTMLSQQQVFGDEKKTSVAGGDQLQSMIRDRVRLSIKDQNQVQLWTQSRQFANPEANGTDHINGVANGNGTGLGQGKK